MEGQPRQTCGNGNYCGGDVLDHQLAQTGLYTIVIRDFGVNSAGTYNISLSKIPTALRPGVYNPSPANGASVCNLNGSFSWDPVSGATGYDVYILDYITMYPAVKICDNVSSPLCLFPTLETGKTYYWGVVAHTPTGDISSPVWWFYTDPNCAVPFTYYCDKDNDLHINASLDGTCTGAGCVPAGCQTTPGNDCNDSDATINPGVIEGPYGSFICSDGKDNNCNGKWDTVSPNPEPNCQPSTSDLIVSAFSVPLTGAACQNITVTDTTKNQGTGPAGTSTTKFYFSTDATYSAEDKLICSRVIPPLGPITQNTGSTECTLPCGITDADMFYILAIADADNVVAETNEINNLKNDSIKIGADLIISALTAPSTAKAGTTITIGNTTKNNGTGDAGASTNKFYLSVDTKLFPWDKPLGCFRAVIPLAVGESNAGSMTCLIPSDTLPGKYYIFCAADADGVVPEMNDGNNTKSKLITIN
ncbi:MAG: hypothetical protein HY755_07980 [Nitrospirae bacterium]|nr:hypothetical protein [Nitrospirota bacterium]